MTAVGLARLLERLDSDSDRAAQEFERLRRTLVRFFDWRGAWPSDECADDAIDRLARKLEEDTSVEDVWRYAHGIARLVLLEWHRRPTMSSLDDHAHLVGNSSPADEDDALRDCLDRCLAELSVESRSVVLGYYEGDRHVKISNRRRLATTLGLSENALRSRVQRLRNRIEICVHQCASRNEL